MNYLFYLALETIPLGIAVALEFTGPLAVAMFSSRRAIDFLWIILVIAGLGLLLPIGDNIHGLDPLGILYALGAGVGWALYIVFGQRAGKGYGAATVSIGSLIAAFIFFPIGMLQSSPELVFSWSILPIGLAIAILSTAFPYTLEMIELADGFVALPGGFGTLEEFSEVFTWSQIGLHQKPLGIFNINDFYQPLLAMIDKMVDEKFLHEKYRHMAIVEQSPIQLLDKFESYIAPSIKTYDK
ncbi:LOG family protein [Proteus mirabilis]|nr:LOG family protein [Proteus mirabilis]MCD4597379.1 LOG family protein [Proteus mirabilis]